MTRWPLGAVASIGLALACLAVAACGATQSPASAPAITATPPPAGLGPASAETGRRLVEALGSSRLIAAPSPIPYRPAEVASLAAAPRTVYQVALPAEPDGGFIVVYELPDAAAAADAAKEQHAYLVSGPGKVQSPLGTHYVLQQLGSTVILYQWLPPASVDPGAARIADVLRTIGTSFEVRD